MRKNHYLSWITIVLLVSTVYGANNPAAVYCGALGYAYEKRDLPEGEMGFCNFPGNSDCNAEDFMIGKCGTNYSYCATKGYQQKSAVGAECSPEYPTTECLLCILPNGSKAEVTALMNLNYDETKCGDGICIPGFETHESCPQDCPETATTLEEGSTTTTWVPITTQPPETTTQPPGSITSPEETTIPSEASTTTIPESLCGNGVCDASENFGSCSKDCSKPTGPVDYLPYIVIIVVLLVILFVVKKKLDEKKIAKEKAEFEKWKQEKGGNTL